MSWFSEFISDSEDWVEEVFGKAGEFSKKLVGKLVDEAIKKARLKFQDEAVVIINDIEEKAVEEAAKLYPGVDEATIRGIYWTSVNKVKEKMGGAEWLVDTD